MGARNERVLLLLPSGRDYLIGFVACLYAGAIAVPVFPPHLKRPSPRVGAISADADARFALTARATTAYRDRIISNTPALRRCIWISIDGIDAQKAYEWKEFSPRSSDLAFLQYTSGSTGTPKGVMVCHDNLVYNIEWTARNCRLDSSSVSVSWLPPFHDMGLIEGLLVPIYTGFLGVSMPPMAFLKQPMRWLRAVTDYNGTHSSAPNFAFDLCVQKSTPQGRHGLDLSLWKSVLIAAEPVRRSTIEAFCTVFEPFGFDRHAFCPGYGLAEATLTVSVAFPEADLKYCSVPTTSPDPDQTSNSRSAVVRLTETVACGSVLPGTEIAIVNPQSRIRCRMGSVGEIWLRGPAVARGYWNQREETLRTFGARIAGEESHTYLRTGDLGFLKNDELFITGRLKEIIILNGQNYYPHDIELTCAGSHEAFESVGGAAFSVDTGRDERVVVAHEVNRLHLRKLNPEPVVKALCRAVADAHGIPVHAVVLIPPGHLPRTSSGKVQRTRCRQMYHDHTFEALYHWSCLEQINDLSTSSGDGSGLSGNIEDFLIQEISRRRALPVESVALDASFVDFGLDSVDMAEITETLEQNLPLSLDPNVFWSYPTIRHLVFHIQNSLESRVETKLVSE